MGGEIWRRERSVPGRVGNGRPLRGLADPSTLAEFVRRVREGIYIATVQGEVLDANPAFLRLFGASSLEELQRCRAEDLFVDPADRGRELEILAREGSLREFEVRIRRRDGEVRTVLDSCFTVHDPANGGLLVHGILIDITPRKLLESQLREESIRDPLTGSYNRRYLRELEKQLLTDDAAWGVVAVDIDHFKDYNDRHGHQKGDEVLIQVVRFLNRRLRAGDAVVRTGGDEFIALLPGEDAAEVSAVLTRLEREAHREAPVPLSMGWAARRAGENLEDTIARADRKLIQVRVEGRNYGVPRRNPRSRR